MRFFHTYNCCTCGLFIKLDAYFNVKKIVPRWERERKRGHPHWIKCTYWLGSAWSFPLHQAVALRSFFDHIDLCISQTMFSRSTLRNNLTSTQENKFFQEHVKHSEHSKPYTNAKFHHHQKNVPILYSSGFQNWGLLYLKKGTPSTNGAYFSSGENSLIAVPISSKLCPSLPRLPWKLGTAVAGISEPWSGRPACSSGKVRAVNRRLPHRMA